MGWIKAVACAFSIYTRIPIPSAKWDETVLKRTLSFLPLIGFVIGGVVWGWTWLCVDLELSGNLFAAVAVALPILLTGGIHMDGYCDTSDALASWKGREDLLKILKDPHVGAFALIRCLVYLLLSFGLLHELFIRQWAEGVFFVYPLSRCLAAWNAYSLPKARDDGMLAAVARKPSPSVWVVLTLLSAVSVSGLLYRVPIGGAVALVFYLPLTLWYRRMVRKRFGGDTGDTTGFFLQTAELTSLAGLLTGGILWQRFF